MSTKTRARFVLLLILGVASVQPASGFYFRGWPGDGRPREQNLVSSLAPKIGGPSLGEDELFTIQQPGTLPDRHSHPHGQPPVVPEPATGLLAGLGAILVYAGHRWRKLKAQTTAHR